MGDIGPKDAPISRVVERIAEGSPQAPALSAGGRTIAYGELVELAARVAAALQGLGVEPGALVGLCVERSIALVVATLGIVRAGAAYVAIDPAYPDQRVEWMLADAGVAAVVVDTPNADRVDPSLVLAPDGLIEGRPTLADAPARCPGPEELAYVVYTSGSTGEPKGAMIEHRSLRNLVAWHLDAFALTSEDRCTQISSPGFDAAVWEIWPALAAGASIHVVPEALRRDPIGLRDWLVSERVTVSFLPTVMAEAMISLSWPPETALRHLLTGGDALTRRPMAGLPFQLVNNYGLSETTVVATSGVVEPGEGGVPTIGRPIDGVLAEVVDDRLAPVAEGEPGELVIGGVAVARGYLNRPELTAERFLAPSDDVGQRRYRTGDRVRRLTGGELEFLGRVDDQLSIRGFRVEPGEVLAVLNAHPGVSASAVVGSGAPGAERRLVAYLVADGDARPHRGDLDVFLAERLPGHLVPSAYVWLDELPLTAHGKLDRDALPPPRHDSPAPSGNSGPTSEVELSTAAIMAELLGLEQIGLEENFFLLGGHSMLGAQLIVRLEESFGVEVGLRFLFDHPTAAEIAAEVERQLAPVSAAVK